MKKIFYLKYLIVCTLFLFYSVSGIAQCPGGYTRDTLNWGNLDFLPNTGTYTSPTAWITLAQSQTQKFTLGTQTVTVTHNYSTTNDPGENTTNTGEAGSYGNGADVQFLGNGVITFTFQTAVQNVKFSVYDIDRSQKVTITALNGVTAQNITMAKISGTVLTIAGSGTTSASATAAAAVNVANTSTDGTINVDIAGPVTSFTITVTATTTNAGEDGSFWIGDVSACSFGTFPATYWNVSKPYTGMPSYILLVRDSSVYYADPATGKAKLLFTDPARFNLNSLAYDPVRHFAYYTYTTTGPGGTLNQNDKTLKRYDYDLDTLGNVTTNVNLFNIPTYEEGVESGAAGFYNGSLYLGIEAADGGRTSNREHIVWKMDFNASYALTTVSQALGTPSDNGSGSLLYDWGDIVINNGMLYSLNIAAGFLSFNHFNLLTGTVTNFTPSPGSLSPKQASIDWTGQVYNVGGLSGSTGSIAPYNYNGTVGTAQTVTVKGVAVTGNWGDAGEAFKPKTDFGDAPASYDPAGSDPAVTESDTSLYLGPLKPGIEWAKKTSSDATGDGAEEDGINGLPVVNTGVHNFVVPVKVYNNSGSNATLIAWFDYNNNGVYDPGEGKSYTIPSSASVQTINVSWTSILIAIPVNTYGFLRLRVTSASNGMTTSNPTGYFPNGEVEDFRVFSTTVLPINKIDLTIKKKNNQSVDLSWNINNEEQYIQYELQNSYNQTDWHTINMQLASGTSKSMNYFFNDTNPALPITYYRIKGTSSSGEIKYSEIRKVDFKNENSLLVKPNPANSKATLSLKSVVTGNVKIKVFDFKGAQLFEQTVKVSMGINEIYLPVQNLSNGIYKISVLINNEILNTTLQIVK